MARKNRKNDLAPLKNVYLTGFMCAGKTTAGRALARLLRLPFLDSDKLVEKKAGAAIAALVEKKGLARFRALEAAQLRGLAALGGRVIALGGGIYPSRRWKALLNATGTTVFLSCPWPELKKRLEAGRGARPLLAGPRERAAARAKRLYAARLPFYNMAEIKVSTAGLTPEKTAALIKARLGTVRGHL